MSASLPIAADTQLRRASRNVATAAASSLGKVKSCPETVIIQMSGGVCAIMIGRDASTFLPDGAAVKAIPAIAKIEGTVSVDQSIMTESYQ